MDGWMDGRTDGRTDGLDRIDKIDRCKKRLKMPKEQSETVNQRRADNPMAKRKQTTGQKDKL
jgi:hypothetical protein